MLLSIVIPSLVRRSSLEKLIHSCDSQVGGIEFEILVIHLADDENIKKISCKNPLRFISISEKNVSLARNKGASDADGKYILFLDDDVILPRKDFLIDLIEKFKVLSQKSILGGGYLNSPSTSCIQRVGNSLANMWIQSGIEKASPYDSSIYSCHFLVGGILILEKSVAQQCPFPELIPWGGEDTAFIHAAKDNGFSIFYCKDLNVIHEGSSSLIKFLRRAWLSGKVQKFISYRHVPFKKKIMIVKQNMGFSSLLHLPLMALHLLILKISRAFYKIR